MFRLTTYSDLRLTYSPRDLDLRTYPPFKGVSRKSENRNRKSSEV